MAHSPEKRQELRAAYIGGLPLEQAAEKVGVPFGTARNWFREARDGQDDWDKFQRVSLMIAGGGIEQALGRVIAAGLLRCEALLEKIAASAESEDPMESVKATATLADTVAKLRAAGKNLMPEADALAVANETVKGLSELFCRLHPAESGRMAATVEAWAGGQR